MTAHPYLHIHVIMWARWHCMLIILLVVCVAFGELCYLQWLKSKGRVREISFCPRCCLSFNHDTKSNFLVRIQNGDVVVLLHNLFACHNMRLDADVSRLNFVARIVILFSSLRLSFCLF